MKCHAGLTGPVGTCGARRENNQTGKAPLASLTPIPSILVPAGNLIRSEWLVGGESVPLVIVLVVIILHTSSEQPWRGEDQCMTSRWAQTAEMAIARDGG